jgi:predicted nucleic acid-binding protein
MKVLIDTNIILDVLLNREPFAKAAYEILKKVEEEKLKAYITAVSITDIYYFIRKNLSHENSIKAIKALFNILNIISITKTDIEKAIQHTEYTDLEDALQYQASIKIGCDKIVTRDKKFRKICNIAVLPVEIA